jgi:7,8-dihydroneopterin aldolase/epimerase/oxygenase
MPDRILLQGVQFHGHHGVHEEERKLGQRFLVDVEIRLDLREAGGRDDLTASVDYGRIHALVVEIGTREQFRLLEALAERIASAILEQFRVTQVTVRATKPSPPLPGIVAGASVEITRP